MQLARRIGEQGAQCTLVQGRQDDAGDREADDHAFDEFFGFGQAEPLGKGGDQFRHLHG